MEYVGAHSIVLNSTPLFCFTFIRMLGHDLNICFKLLKPCFPFLCGDIDRNIECYDVQLR